MSEAIDATGIPAMPLEIERLKRSKTWRKCRAEPFLAFYVLNVWTGAFHGVPAGSLEDDDEALIEISQCPPLEWIRMRPLAMHGFEKRADGRLHHPIIEAVAKQAVTARDARKRTAKPAAETPQAILDAFEAFWIEYPRKIAKGAARTAYARALKKTGAEALLDSVKRFARLAAGREQRLVPHPTTWLNGERWLDGALSSVAAAITPAPSLWNGRGAALAAAIGPSAFEAWFGEAQLSADGHTITFAKSFKRDWAERTYTSQIRRVLGECRLDVQKS
jgi:hypothetical protein